MKHRREGEDFSAQIEPVVVYQQEHTEFEITDVPAAFRPRVGALGLEYWDRVYASLPGEDAFSERGISRDGAVVVVRPDQYVAGVFALDDVAGIARYFDGVLV